MACIVCLAAIAAVMFTAGVSVEEWMNSRLKKVAASGETTRETDSILTWRGEFPLVMDDGSTKLVRATIHLFKDSGRVKIHIEDHSLTQEEAERLEDEIAEALGLVCAGPGGLRRTLWIFPIVLGLYTLVFTATYAINTFYAITWWLDTSLNRILFALMPMTALWVFLAVEDRKNT